MERLVIPALLLESIREAVLREDGHEWFAFGLCGRSGGRYLVTDIRSVSEDNHVTKAHGGCRVDPEVELSFLDECVGHRSRIPLLIHSHPFHSGPGVGFSSLDAEMMESMTQWLEGAYPDRGEGPLFAVVGQDSIRVGRYEDSEGRSKMANIEELPVEILGEWELDRTVSRTKLAGLKRTHNEADRDRHDRTIRALTEDGQAQLAGARVGIVSAGGIGSLLVEQLARLGVGELVVADPDVVEESNLNRLYGASHEDISRDKVVVMEQHAESIDPSLDIEVHAAPAQEVPDALRTCDLLVAGVDRISARMWLNEFAVRHFIPYVDAGTIIRMDNTTDAVTEMEGIVQTIVPGVTGCFACLDRGDPEQARIERLSDAELESEVEDGYVEESVLTPEPAVVHLNSLVASKAVDMVVRLLTGFDSPSGLIRYEGLGNQLDAFQTQPAEQCQVCGSDQLLGRGVPAHETMSADEIASEPVDDVLDDDEVAARAADTVDVDIDDDLSPEAEAGSASSVAEDQADNGDLMEPAVRGEASRSDDARPTIGVSRGLLSKFTERVVPAFPPSFDPRSHSGADAGEGPSKPDPGGRYSSDEEVSGDGG